jgi:ABC-type branched-subunit amino acid transport system substrate-binding protein
MAAATAALLFVAGCGSSSGGTSGVPSPALGAAAFAPGPDTGWSANGVTVDSAKLSCATPSGSQTRGVTDTEIKVGGLITQTSNSGPVNTDMDTGAKVRFDRANAEGGVNGRKIDYIGTYDDGSDASRLITQARSLANAGVFAAVPTVVRQGTFADTFCKTATPYFGWGTNDGYCGSTLGFGITGCLVAGSRALTVPSSWGLAARSILGGSTGKSAAVVGTDLDAAASGVKLAAKAIKDAGVAVPYAKNPVPAAGLTDTTALVNNLMTANNGAPPDLIVMILDFSPAIKLIDTLRADGYTGKILTPLGYDPRLAGFKDLDGTYTLLQWAPTESGSAADEQMRADFAKYAPGTSLGLTAQAGYWAADFFLDAVKKTGHDLTLANLLKTLNSGTYTYSVPGAVPESQWPVNHSTETPCGSVVQLTGGKYVQTMKLACTSLIANQ